jgi:excisionase family DNA binding protein
MVENSAVPQPLLKIQEVALILRRSDRFVSRLIASGKLPAVSLGTRSLRVRPQDLNELLNPENTTSPASHPDSRVEER